MRLSFLLSAVFAGFAFTQTTVIAISELSDGQPQAPTGQAASSSSPASTTDNNNPSTSLTKSGGTVTSIPSVLTSQPSISTSDSSAITTQPVVVTPVPTITAIYTQPSTNYNATLAPVLTSAKSNFTFVSSAQVASVYPSTFSIVTTSVGTAATTTGPFGSESTTNTATWNHFAGSGLILATAGWMITTLIEWQ